jgi:hypothetical protein
MSDRHSGALTDRLHRQGGVVRERDGNLYDVADKIVKWLVGAERWFDRATLRGASAARSRPQVARPRATRV